MVAEVVAKARVIDKIGGDIDAMGESIKLARTYLNDNTELYDANGVYLSLVGDHIKSKRQYMSGWYDDYITHVVQAGADIRKIGVDFTKTDGEQRREYDRLYRTKIHDLNGNVGEIIQTPYDYAQDNGADIIEQPGFGNGQAREELVKPHNAYDDSFQSVYWDLSGWVDEMLSFKDDLKPISAFGLDNPFEGWLEKWEGRWENVGTSCDALRNLANYWERISHECTATLGRFDGSWEGRAANNAANWIDRFYSQSLEHRNGLIVLADEILHRGLVIKDAIIPLVELINDIVDTIASIVAFGDEFDLPSLEDIGNALKNPGDALKGLLGKGEDLAKKAGDMLQKLGKLLGHAKKTIEIVVLALDALFLLFDQFNDDDLGLTNFWAGYSLPEARR
jgi:hypothetical protein